MKKRLAIIALLAGFFLGSAAITYATTTFRVVETPTYHLYSGESGTATSLRITPYPTDLDGVSLTMTDFGTSPTFTVDPGFKGIEEIESFTGIINNGDGTATLTGLSRDLASKYPYTTAGTGRTHGSGAIVVFGNNPQIYGRLAAPENDQVWTGIQYFNVSPLVNDANSTSTLQLASRAYVNSVVASGCANSSETVNGCAQLATATQAASSTSSGSTAARLVLPASLATSSDDVAGLHVVVTQNSGKINWNQIDLGTPFTITALATFSGGFIDTASSTVNNTFNVTGAANLNGTNTFGGATVFNNTVAFNSAVKSLPYILSVNSSSTLLAANTGTTTVFAVTIPANTLSTTSVLRIEGNFGNTTTQASGNFFCNSSINIGNGSATTTIAFQPIFTGPTTVASLVGSIDPNTPTSQTEYFTDSSVRTSSFATAADFLNTFAAATSYSDLSNIYIGFALDTTSAHPVNCNLLGETVTLFQK